jgi:pimeloyl-ACP methyl ester carboxylesterase
VITTERPGFGASSRLPGRGFAETADDLAAILDQLGLEQVPVIGGSGSAPHQLALAARHPDRIAAMTILVGAAPLLPAEVEQLVGVNRQSYALVQAGDVAGLRSLLSGLRDELLADPLASINAIMDRAPDSDRAVMADPGWQEAFVIMIREALEHGIDGWADEGIAVQQPWDDVDLTAVECSVTWWHAAADANAPLSAAQRLVDQLPSARLQLFSEHEGHMAGYHREAQILDELLGRI